MWFCRVVLRRLERGELVEGLYLRREGGGVVECILCSFLNCDIFTQRTVDMLLF